MADDKDEVTDETKDNSQSQTTTNLPTTSFTRENINSVNLFDPNQLSAVEVLLGKIMRSDKGGIKSVNDGLAVLMRAKDLNLPFSTCIEHIHVINGKTGVDIHIIKALLLKAGVTWECTKDYAPLYEYTDGINVYVDGNFPDYVKRCKSSAEAEKLTNDDQNNGVDDFVYVYPVKWYKDFNNNVYKDYQLSSAKFTIVVNVAQGKTVVANGKTPVYRVPNVPVDFVYEYELTRDVKGKTLKAKGRFSYNDAVLADMFDKDTYKKYPKVLISHRAFTYAARDIASDIIFGVMETTELKIVTGNNITDRDVNSVEDAEIIDITDNSSSN